MALQEPSDSSRRPLPALRELGVLSLVLAAFAGLAVGARIGLPFVGDDYVFMDKTRAATFAELWSPTKSIDFGWYRPWAREVHFWVLQRALDLNPTAYRLVNVGLWIGSLLVFWAVLRKLASPRVAAIAALGVAPLALWGTPLLWISGSQDLWMLAFVLLSLLLFLQHQAILAAVVFIFALLSKETAGVLPALLCAYLMIGERRTLWQAIRRTWLFWTLLLSWALLHPTLRTRLLGGLASSTELQQRPSWHIVLLKSVAACLNLDRVPHPQEVDASDVCRVLASAILLAAAVMLFARRTHTGLSSPDARPITTIAVAWTVIGWCPSFLPSIGWHAYYGCLGALGAWFWAAIWLQARPAVAAALIGVLAILRGAQANTVSSDWGDEAYIQTAGSTLEAIRLEMVRQHPTLPPHSRVYFANIPYHIGLIAGESPALRVWYADGTLQAGYYSYYAPRTADAPPGPDYFLRFDPAVGMVEVKAGAEDVEAAVAANPLWEEDHDGLADLFVFKDDLPRAAVEYEKLAHLDHRPDAALRSAACLYLLGDSAKAEALVRGARPRFRGTDLEIQLLLSRIQEHTAERLKEGRSGVGRSSGAEGVRK